MCHCGDHYCDMRKDARDWANSEHTRLLSSGEWTRKHRDAVDRDVALVPHIRTQVISRFGPMSVGFKWEQEEKADDN